jgi:hypothetical protein
MALNEIEKKILLLSVIFIPLQKCDVGTRVPLIWKMLKEYLIYFIMDVFNYINNILSWIITAIYKKHGYYEDTHVLLNQSNYEK